MFTDTHCHLTAQSLLSRLPEVLADAAAAGVGGFIVPATRPSDWDDTAALCPQPCVRAAALGLHPWFADQACDTLWQDLDRRLRADTALWAGETGLDFRRARSEDQRRIQLNALHHQLHLAQQHRRPVILHNVRAAAALSGSLKHTGFTCGGIVHAFSGSIEEAEGFIRQGFLIGLGSLLLNPKAKKARAAAARLPEHSIVLETDSPYMLPGGTNTPANLAAVAAIVAQLRGISLEKLADTCEKNLRRLPVQTLRNPNP